MKSKDKPKPAKRDMRIVVDAPARGCRRCGRTDRHTHAPLR